MALSTRCSHPARHTDVTRVRRPAGLGQALFDDGSSNLAPDPDPLRHEPDTAPLPGTESAPPRASGSAYACSATKALAGRGAIAVPHTAANDLGGLAVGPQRVRRQHSRSFRCGARYEPLDRVSALAQRQRRSPLEAGSRGCSSPRATTRCVDSWPPLMGCKRKGRGLEFHDRAFLAPFGWSGAFVRSQRERETGRGISYMTVGG